MEVFVFDWWWASHQSSAHKKCSYSQILYCVWVRYTRTLAQTPHGKKDWRGSKVHRNTETWDRSDAEPIEFEWNIFPGCTTLQLSHKVQELLLRLGETPENFTGRIIFMSMFNDISCGSKDNKKECESNAQLVSLFAKRFRAGQWSFIGPGSEKKKYSISEDSPQGEWNKKAEKMMITLRRKRTPSLSSHEPIVQRSAQKQKAVENCQSTIVPTWIRLQLFFFSHNYLCKSAQS